MFKKKEMTLSFSKFIKNYFKNFLTKSAFLDWSIFLLIFKNSLQFRKEKIHNTNALLSTFLSLQNLFVYSTGNPVTKGH